MAWGEIEVEPEVAQWLGDLTDDAFGMVEFHLDRLAEEGALLGEPSTRQLRGKLRELRFYSDREQIRITYFIASGRRIILLTVFRKRRRQERAEIERAHAAMERCMAEQHTAEDEE